MKNLYALKLPTENNKYKASWIKRQITRGLVMICKQVLAEQKKEIREAESCIKDD